MSAPTDTVANSDMPAVAAIAVTPHASTNIDSVTRALYVGAGGDIAAVMTDDSVVSFVAVPTGTILPVRVKRVNAIGTSASSIVALF